MDDPARAIGEELMGRALDSWTATGGWRADLRSLGFAIHSSYLAHPQAAVLAASRVSERPREIAVDETILGILRGAGLPDTAAVRFYHAFIDLSLAFAALDAAPLTLAAQARAADEERRMKRCGDSTYARLPASSHPDIAATAGLLAAQMQRSAYSMVLDTLLDTIAAELGAPR